jgi:hypothetical protein
MLTSALLPDCAPFLGARKKRLAHTLLLQPSEATTTRWAPGGAPAGAAVVLGCGSPATAAVGAAERVAGTGGGHVGAAAGKAEAPPAASEVLGAGGGVQGGSGSGSGSPKVLSASSSSVAEL